MDNDPYETLGINPNASEAQIKAAYRKLVKKYHPDTGGDTKKIIFINAAWELLRDPTKRFHFDQTRSEINSFKKEAKNRGERNARASAAAKAAKGKLVVEDRALFNWLANTYIPSDRLLGQIINPFQNQLKSLSADPYDDLLMESFCDYIENSQKKIERVEEIYRALNTPDSAKVLSLNLYHCLSLVKDALIELNRYTMGYVDSYLSDGREMMREAKQKRTKLHSERRLLQI